ncbi:MAG TPA: hypothetical protein VEC35_09555 [Noviherbaspirillum sp.]|nr:hypothetical protein [Noviherbaspirillum sp.]
MKKALSRLIDITTSDRFGKAYSTAACMGYVLLFACGDAAANGSLKQAGVNVFRTIYELIGVIGGIILLLHIINWKAGNFFGREDPKKSVVNTMIGIGAAYGIVGIIHAIKTFVGGGSADIGSL